MEENKLPDGSNSNENYEKYRPKHNMVADVFIGLGVGLLVEIILFFVFTLYLNSEVIWPFFATYIGIALYIISITLAFSKGRGGIGIGLIIAIVCLPLILFGGCLYLFNLP